MTIDAALDTLRYFNDKVDRLSSLKFTQYVAENAIATPNLLTDALLCLEESVPDDESIEAFVLTLRFFCQNKEPISIARIADLYESLPVDEETKALVRECRAELNRHLDSYSHLGIAGERLRQREIFEVFLYGGLAHGSDKAKRERFQSWRAAPRRFAYLKTLFVMLLMDWLEVLFWLREFNRRTIAQLDSGRGAA